MHLLVKCAASCLDFDCFLDCFLVLWMRRRQLFNFQDVHAEIADLTETLAGELCDCFAYSAENIFNRMKRVTAADRLKEVA